MAALRDERITTAVFQAWEIESAEFEVNHKHARTMVETLPWSLFWTGTSTSHHFCSNLNGRAECS